MKPVKIIQEEEAPVVEPVNADEVIVWFKDGDGNQRGYGILVSNDWLAITNKHVVEWLEEEIVVTYKWEDYVIDYVGKHAYDDYALVRIYDIETACWLIEDEKELLQQTFTSLLPTQETYTHTVRETLMQWTIRWETPFTQWMSGTPLFTDKGTVAGLIQARDERFENTGKISLLPESIEAWITKKAIWTNCQPISL